MNCADACPAKALILYGETKSVEEVLRVVEQESIFYSRSGGGMTLSGGEPLLQAEFSLALLREAKRRRIKTAIETCGYVQLDVLEEACTLANTLLFDIKSMNSTKHRAFTGASNETILNNFREVRERFPKLSILVRTPVIPDFNDTEDDILAVLGLLKSTPNVAYELLPYHRLGIQKYAYLGREYLMDAGTVLSSETIERLRSLVG
jgi:pyruvate formate lyase activating enzyme